MMTAAAATGLLAQGVAVLPEHKLRVLIVEDSTTDANLILQVLRRTGRLVEFDRVEDEAAMRVALASRPWDLIVSDWSLPKFSGLGALAVAKQNDLEIPFIIVSGTIGEEMAVDAMRAGAHDYVLKDKLARLVPAVERELRDSESRRQRKQAEKALAANEERLREAQRIEAIGRLAGSVAHTLNDLLSIVLSYSAIALERPTPEVVMPRISGPELAEILTFVRPNLRVLYMSGYNYDGIVGRGVFESVAYLQKPITPAVLARKVREVLTTPIRPSSESRSLA